MIWTRECLPWRVSSLNNDQLKNVRLEALRTGQSYMHIPKLWMQLIHTTLINSFTPSGPQPSKDRKTVQELLRPEQ